MDEEAKKALLDSVKTQNKEQIDAFTEEYKNLVKEASEGTMSKEDVDKALEVLEKKINDAPNEVVDDLVKSLKTVQEELKAAQLSIKKFEDEGLNDKPEATKGVGDLLRAAMEKAGIIEEYVVDTASGRKAKMMKGYESNSTKYSLKAAIDMTTALTLLPGQTPGTNIGFLTDYKMKDVQINLTKDVHVIQFLPTDPISDKYMGVLIEYDYTDGSAVKAADGAAAGKSSLLFKTVEFKVFTIPTYFRISKENLADIDRLVSKLNRIAPDKILSTFDGRVLSTTGDNSTDIKGMYVTDNFTPFVAATFADSVENATIIDLIRKMKLQALLDDQDVNVVILHPSAVDEIEGLKDADRNFLMARGIVYDEQGNLVRVHGLTVIKNKLQTTTRVTVMWNEAAEVGIREDINFEIGLDGNDLTEGMRTIVFEMRAAFGVGKVGGITVSSDPETDIATINKVIA